MDEKLIEEIKKHKNLFTKNCLEYGNRKGRAKAWKAVSEAIGSSESSCRARWKSLRDRYVREYVRTLEVGAGAEVKWEFYPLLSFLAPYVKRRNSSSIKREPTVITKSDFEYMENDSFTQFEAELVHNDDFNTETFVEFTNCAVETPSNSCSDEQFNEITSVPLPGKLIEIKEIKKVEKQPATHVEEFKKFLTNMNTIVEKKLCTTATHSAKCQEHEGFFLMVQELFAKLPEYEVDDAKVFFINHLHQQIKNCRL